MTKIKSFKIDGSIIEIISDTENKYTITKTECNCKGFAFRKKCGHFDEAKKNGLIDILKNSTKSATIFKSPMIIKERKKAIIWFLTKYGKKFDDALVDKIESFVTMETKPEEVLVMAK